MTAQKALHQREFPCPEPLTTVGEVEGLAVHVETYVPDGERYLGIDDETVDRFASLLADLTGQLEGLDLAPPEPSPPWLAWDHPGPEVWQDDCTDHPLGRPLDVPDWLTNIARRVRERIASARLPSVVSHGDWETQHIHWRNGEIWVVHDWDSLSFRPEAALAGAAAATFASDRQPVLAPLAASERFLLTYQRRRGKRFTKEESEVAWASGLWLATHNAMMEIIHHKGPLVLQALVEQGPTRLARAGA